MAEELRSSLEPFHTQHTHTPTPHPHTHTHAPMHMCEFWLDAWNEEVCPLLPSSDHLESTGVSSDELKTVTIKYSLMNIITIVWCSRVHYKFPLQVRNLVACLSQLNAQTLKPRPQSSCSSLSSLAGYVSHHLGYPRLAGLWKSLTGLLESLVYLS